jgi:hypothetical protein
VEPFVVVVPDRGDRKVLTDHCLWQISRMTVKPDYTYLINYAPLSTNIDLVERVKNGVASAQNDGYDLCFILENDDFYGSDYFERFGNMKEDFFGQNNSWYYNLRNRTYKNLTHAGRSSLFTTGFRISALERFRWPDNTPFLDIKFWEHANTYNKKIKFVETGAIGIKTGMGLCGGKGHRMVFENRDPDLAWLKKRVDWDSFEFYSGLKL